MIREWERTPIAPLFPAFGKKKEERRKEIRFGGKFLGIWEKINAFFCTERSKKEEKRDFSGEKVCRKDFFVSVSIMSKLRLSVRKRGNKGEKKEKVI